MKLVLVIEDESWFWIYNEETWVWEAWYEVNDLVPIRLDKSDRVTVYGVTQLMAHMADETLHDAQK